MRAIVIVLALVLTACGIKRPGVTSSANARIRIPHTGNMLVTCTACHLSQMPSIPVGSPPFDHAGITDCVTCHKNPGTTWEITEGSFSHTPMPANCMSCHANDRPLAGNSAGVPDHTPAPLNGECVTCHNLPANAGVTWKGAVPQVVTLKAFVTANSLTNHNVSFPHPPANTYTSCAQCHAGGDFKKVSGFNHAGLTTNVTIDGVAPANMPDLGRNAYNAVTNPTYCVMCHTTGSPYVTPGLARQVRVGNHEGSVSGQDCTSCHRPNVPVVFNPNSKWDD